MRRRSKKLSAVLAGLIIVVAMFASGLVGWHACAAVQKAALESGAVAGNVMEVTVACDGRTESNVELRAFVSGVTVDGSAFEEQVSFGGRGAQEVALPVGGYQVAPRFSLLMLEDGTVLSAGDPIACRFAGGESSRKTVELVYRPVDMALMANEELAEIASDSFVDEEAAARALELSKGLRDAAPAPDLDTPDIDGETPGDLSGPLDAAGGE